MQFRDVLCTWLLGQPNKAADTVDRYKDNSVIIGYSLTEEFTGEYNKASTITYANEWWDKWNYFTKEPISHNGSMISRQC